MIVEMKESSLKTDRKGFNSLPSQKEIRERMKETGLRKALTFVDAEGKDYWQNRSDTIVFKLPKNAGIEIGIALADFINITAPDEYHKFETADAYVVRLWWD